MRIIIHEILDILPQTSTIRVSHKKPDSTKSHSPLVETEDNITYRDSKHSRTSTYSIDEEQELTKDRQIFRTGSRKVKNGYLKHLFNNKRVCIRIFLYWNLSL